MKSRVASALCAVVLACAVPAFSDCYMYFGGNYSNTVSDGSVSHGVGGNYTIIVESGGVGRFYTGIGLVADVTNRNINTDELKKLGVNGIDTNFYTVPMRFGYPVMLGVTDSTKFLIIPSLAFDMHFFNADFTQRIARYGYVMESYDMSGWGYSLGASLNLGMQHRINKMYMRYGVDFDFRFLTILLADIEYSGVIRGTTTSSAFDTVSDYVMFTTSPYLCIGFKL